MAATVHVINRKRSSLGFNKKGRFVEATFDIAPKNLTRGTCSTCGGPVHRSWRTGILHSRCFFCRYLVMLYGPSIKVSR